MGTQHTPKPQLVSTERSPKAPAAVKMATPPPSPLLHPPLLKALSAFQQTQLSASRIVFHGCSKDARDTNVAARLLIGTRKWFSSDAEYAVDYAGSYGGSKDGGVLWICKVCADVPSLIGRQAHLQSAAPWKPQEFPWKFPNEFESYAQAIFACNGPVALLDHRDNVGYREILITSPEQCIEVVDVIELPTDQEEARSIGKRLNSTYASERAI